MSDSHLIPKIFHFVFGLRPQVEAFHLVHYLCLKSCIEVNRPDLVVFHYHYEPFGDLWEKIRPDLTLNQVEPVDFVINHEGYSLHEEGAFIKFEELDYAHQADFLRLQMLVDTGGVYADMDTIFINPLPLEMLEHPFVIGSEGAMDSDGVEIPSLCNAFMLSAPNAPFAKKWLDRSYAVFDGTWSRHSCQEASLLARQYPEDVHIVPQRNFYLHSCTQQGLIDLFINRVDDYEEVYSFHLWSHLWWDTYRRDFVDFDCNLITEEYIEKGESTYAVVARRFLD